MIIVGTSLGNNLTKTKFIPYPKEAPKGSKAYILNISLDGLIITIAPEKPIIIAIHFQKSILVPKIGIEKIATIKGVNKVKEVAVANLRKINEVKKQN
tara:strand:- start:122 stop:415 length:294 start_codon:yes stop_codon:yes gene_type:complete